LRDRLLKFERWSKNKVIKQQTLSYFASICAKNSINETSATDSIKQGNASDNTQKSSVKMGFNEEWGRDQKEGNNEFYYPFSFILIDN
jgi:hypothetical protein